MQKTISRSLGTPFRSRIFETASIAFPNPEVLKNLPNLTKPAWLVMFEEVVSTRLCLTRLVRAQGDSERAYTLDNTASNALFKE